MHRFIVGESLSKIFDLPEEKAGLIFTVLRKQPNRIQEVMVRDSENEKAYLKWALEDLVIFPTQTTMEPAKFNSMPAGETSWLVMLVHIEEKEGKKHISDVAYLEAKWAPAEAESSRKFSGQTEGFLVWVEMLLREASPEENLKPAPPAVAELLRKMDVDGARLGRKLISVPYETPPWLKEACK